MRRTRLVFVRAAAIVALLAACSHHTDLPPAADQGTAAPIGGGGGGNEGGTTADGSVSDGGACTDLENIGSFQDRIGLVGSPEQGTGGPLIDGTYILTGATLYVPASGQAGDTGIAYRATLRLTQGEALIEEVIDTQSSTGTTTLASAASFVAGGTTLNLTPSCPVNPTESLSYTATATQLTLVSFATLEQLVFTLQQ